MFFMTRWMLCLLLFSLPGLAAATAQIPDAIDVDGRMLKLHTNPLTPLLQARGWVPPADAARSSSNWRGHMARWQLDDDQLVLSDVTIFVRDTGEGPRNGRKRRSIKAELFPGQDRVVANWYTGTLVMPDGEMTRYVHMGYASTYSHYQLVRVQQGQVVARLAMNGDAFEVYRRDSFDAFRKTPEFRKSLADSMARGMGEAQAIQFLSGFHSEVYLSR